MNPVLERLLAERDQQTAFIDQVLERVEGENRDLVDAERSNLDAARQRIGELDAQIEPLQSFESMRHTATEATARSLGRPDGARQVNAAASGRGEYRDVGSFIVDHLRAKGGMRDPFGRPQPPDPNAAARVTRVLENQTTADTPGLLPEPVVGAVMNNIDASRPLLTSLGVKPLGGIPGLRFHRPKITQHVLVGPQAAEKTELPSRKMVIGSVEFAKETYGGSVDISRQDIDWTSPAAWNILVNDLQDIYALTTEQAVAADFAAGITQSVTAATGDVTDVVAALYEAAGLAYAASGRMPDRVWTAVDVWGVLGSLVDVGRMMFPARADGTAGTSNLSSFSGMVLDLPRIVVPSLPAGTLVAGWSGGFEVYEERIGLLSAVEPSILGVEVAYGGYLASGFMNANAFAKVALPAPVSARTTGSHRDRDRKQSDK
jgi:HK97 family phage major capsid protein